MMYTMIYGVDRIFLFTQQPKGWQWPRPANLFLHESGKEDDNGNEKDKVEEEDEAKHRMRSDPERHSPPPPLFFFGSTTRSQSERRGMARRAGWEKLPLSVLDPSTPRRRSSYLRLPEQIIRVSVLKLDGSSFDVEVARAATVVDLKMNIEDIFDKLAEEGGCIISWSHVWGHFCLCYHEYKLIDDGTQLLTLGIKDGDQLHFARHISPNQNRHRRKSTNQVTNFVHHRQSFTQQHIIKEVDKDARSCQEQEGCIVSHKNSKLGHLFQGWNDGLGSSCKTKSRGVSSKIVRRRKRISWAICY